MKKTRHENSSGGFRNADAAKRQRGGTPDSSERRRPYAKNSGAGPSERSGRPASGRGARPARREPTGYTGNTEPPVGDSDLDENRLEGRNSVMEAFRAGRQFNKIWVAQSDTGRVDASLQRIVYLARENKVPVVEVPRNVLDQMSATHGHQGVIAQVASHEYADLDEILARLDAEGVPPFLVMLDGLKDGYNLGSILRIADAAGVHGVIIPKHRSIGLDSLVSKASAGAIEYVPVVRCTNLTQTILQLKERGFWVAGTDASGDVDYKKADYRGPFLLIVGSEGEGMSKTVQEKCDFLLSIPMRGSVNSLNAAVAAGIVIFEAQAGRNIVE